MDMTGPMESDQMKMDTLRFESDTLKVKFFAIITALGPTMITFVGFRLPGLKYTIGFGS